MEIHQHYAGHITKSAGMPIYGKNTLKIFFQWADFDYNESSYKEVEVQ